MATEEDLLRARDPHYLIPNTYKSKTATDLPPWMTADVREHKEDLKLWQHRYKFFSHQFAHQRAEQHCQYFGSMSRPDAMQAAQGAKESCKCVSKWPTLEGEKYTYEATMARIIGNIEEKANRPGHMTQPLWDKYKYFSNNRPKLEADYHQKEQDCLHTFKTMDLPVKGQKMQGARDAKTTATHTQWLMDRDVVEKATAKQDPQRRSTRGPQRSLSAGFVGSAVVAHKNKVMCLGGKCAP